MTRDDVLQVMEAELKASRALIRTLTAAGAIGDLTPADQRLHTRWAEASAQCSLALNAHRQDTPQ